MNTHRRTLLHTFAGGLAAAALPTAWAQPGGATLRLIVGFPPGGAGDQFARILGERLQQELQSPEVIDNKPGGGGLTAVAAFQRAKPDGSTLMLHTGSTAVTAPISRKLPPYNPVDEFAWIALLSETPFLVAVNAALPVTDLKSLINHARAQDGKLSYGHAGLGTTVHLAAELLKERGAFLAADIPYAGSGPALTDTIAGNVGFIVETYGTLIQHHRSGKLRIVGALATARLPELPEVGTASEIGLDVVAGTSNLIAAPLGTPTDKLAALSQAIGKVMARPEMQQQLGALGIHGVAQSSPAEAKAYVAAEVARWTPLVKKLGIAR